MRRVLVTLAVVGTLALGCSSSKGPTLDYTPEFSLLTEAGINQIKESRHARFDLRDHTLTKADVGFDPPVDKGPMVGNASSPELTLEFLGPTGTETVTTRTFMVPSLSKNEPYELIAFWRDFDNPADANTELLAGIERWGFLPAKIQNWITNTGDGEDDKAVLGMGVGPAGLVVEVEARLKNGHQLLRYMVHLTPDLYTPEAQANIRQFGQETRPRGR